MPNENYPESHPENNSDIPEVKIPEGGFKSDIPDFLLEDCTPRDKYLYETLGQVKDYIKWSAPIIVDSNKQVRKTNGRVNKNESDIETLEAEIRSWIDFKNTIISIATNKYFIFSAAILAFLALYPIAIYINKNGGIVSFIETIIKTFFA